MVAGLGCGDVPAGSLPNLRYSVPTNVYVGQTFEVDLSESNDPEDQELYFSIAFGDGQPAQRSESRIVEHRYLHEGRYSLAVTVHDTRGNKFTEFRQISAIRRSPTSYLVCSEDWQYCPAYYQCTFTESWRCLPEQSLCDETTPCPGDLLCMDGTCR